MDNLARQHILAVFIIILLISCVFSPFCNFPIQHARAAGWWNSSYNNYRKITVESDYIDANLDNFPLLVVLDNSSGDYTFHNSGGDIEFLSLDNTTQFNHEVESFDNAGDTVCWVNISETLTSGSDYSFLVYYNNPADSTVHHNPEDVWDNDYIMVQHMDDEDSILDSTFNDNDGAKAGNIDNNETFIGNAMWFDGVDDYITVLDSPSLSAVNTFTYQGWFKFTKISNNPRIFDKHNAAGGYDNEYYMGIIGEDEIRITCYDGDNDYITREETSSAYNDGIWHLISFTYDGSLVHTGIAIYVDGIKVDDAGADTNPGMGVIYDGSDNVYLGGAEFTADNDYRGYIDEVHFSKIERNVSWVKSCFHNQNQSSHLGDFLSFGSEQSPNNPPTQSGEVPANQSTGISLTPNLYVLCNDADNDNMNATWWSNSSGAWLQFASNWTSFANNTNITQQFTNASAYSTKYYWSLNLTDGYNWTNATYHFTTNVLPTLSGESPTNSSIGVSLTPGLYVVCTDADSDIMTATWRSNSSGAWVDFATNTSISTGTNITQPNSNFSAYNTTYYWSVNLTDGKDWINETYHFTTVANNPPTFSSEVPTNGSTNVTRITAAINVTIVDPDGDTFNWTIETSPGIGSDLANDDSNGSKTCSVSGLVSGTTYTWYVNCTDGTDWTNETYHFTTNYVPIQSGEVPVNGSVDQGRTPVCNVTASDQDGSDLTVYFYENTTGSWVLQQTNSSHTANTSAVWDNYANASAYSTTYWWSVNLTDGKDWVNETYSFTTEADTIVFTLISMTPSDILLNSTGYAVLVYNISTSDTGLNATSIFMTHLMNSTEASDPDCQLNTSYILEEEDWLGDKYGSGSRAEDYWFEMFNQSGTGEIGWKGQWRVKNDTLSDGFVVSSWGATWYNFTITIPLEDSFGRIMMGSPQLMRAEDKTGQVFDVYRDNIVKVAYNMSNTCFWYNNQHNNTNYGFHINAVPSASTTKPLRIYFANGSYTGDPQTSPYTELIGQINPGDPYSISPINSNYYHISFSTNETGYVGTVKMDENSSFIFETSQANIGAKWSISYADDIHDHGHHIHNFNSTNCSYLSTDGGDTWTKTNGTIDTFIAYAKLDSTDEIFFKAYAQMNGTATGDGSWSTTYTELIDEGNFAPNNPDVVVPNGTAPTDSYNVGDTINITYNWLGDPNHETCWVNITAYNNVSDTIAYYLQNRSITDTETHVNNTWWYDWETTGSVYGTYYINITATDPDSNMSWGRQNGTFILVNNPPTLSGESPTNESTNIAVTPSLYVVCTDANSDIMTVTWRSNSSGAWVDFATNTSVSTGTNITQPNSNFSAYNTTYYWSINLTDGYNWTNATYHFTTNVLPTLSGESPTNSSIGVSLTPALYVVCTDADSDVMTATWRSNSSSAWVDFATNTSISTGTNITQPNSNFSAYSTTYYWSVNLTDGTDWTNETYHFTTNVLPTLSGESPTNSSIGVSLTPALYVVCTDADSDIMTATWRSNSSGAWVDFATNSSISTGTNITQDNNNFSAYSTTYYWSVNLTDGTDWVNETYHFTTVANNPPTFSNEVPANESTGVAKTITTVNVTIVDPDGDTFNWTIETSPSIGSDLANDDSNGSKTCSVSGLISGTTYTWYVNCTDGTDWTNETYHFTTNYVPTQSDEIPVDGSTGVSLFPVLSVTVADNDASNLMNITFYSNVSGSWSQIGVVIENRSNGTYHQRFDEFGVYGELYWWNCSVSDGMDSVSSGIFSFTAEDEPVISLDYGTIKVYGTEYTQGEPGTAYAQVFYANGTTANAANVYVTVWERVNKYIDNQQMIYIEGSNGCYHYNFTTPSNISVFMMDVNSSNPTAYGSGEFHVSEWASAIPNINETVSDINDTVNYMNDTLNYLNGTYLPALETKIDNIYTLLQTLNTSDLSVLVSSLYSVLNDTYNISYYLNNTIWAGYVASQLYNISNMTYNVTGYINATVGSINTIVNAINSTVDTMITIVTSMDANITLIDITVNAINDTVGYINLTTTYMNSSSMFAMNDTLASINDTVNLLSAEVGNVNKTVGYMNLTVDFINVTRWGNFTAYDLYNISNMTYWLVDAIENIVLHINTTTVAIGSWDWFEVRLTEFGEITPGDDYLAQITVFDKNGEMANADLAPTISLYDSAGNLVVTGISMTWIATGQYTYSYTTAGGQPSGQWTTITRTTVSGHVVKNIIYWELESNPPEVTLTVVDNVFPSISAEISITNEGTGAQEYIYYWWITPRADGDLVDVDTVDSGSASKLIASLDTFTTVKILNVPALGTYWYKVRVYWGTEWSAASAQFDAISAPGAGGMISPIERFELTVICVDDRCNRIPGVKLDLFEDVRFLGSELTNETGVAVFGIPKSMVLSITAAKDGYETVVRSISVSGSMTEVIQMHKIAFAELPWLLLMIIIIIGGIILYCIYRKQTANVKKKRTRLS